METKICCRCHYEFPKTTEYFFKKIIRQKLSTGIVKEYHSFRHLCIKCRGIVANDKRVKRRCIELGCTLENYKETMWKDFGIKKMKYKELVGIPQSLAEHIRDKIDKGYVFTTLEQYKLDVKENYRKASVLRRKYTYENQNSLSEQEQNDMNNKMLPNCKIALMLKMLIKDCPKELIENVRNTLILKRMLGLTFSTKKSRNINNQYSKQWMQKLPIP